MSTDEKFALAHSAAIDSSVVAAHTPGPWRAEAVMSDGPHDICLVNPVRPTQETGWPVVVASVYGGDDDFQIGHDEASANARLIAAAPDLLEACIAVSEWFDRHADAGLVQSEIAYLKKIRAAIENASNS